MMIKSRLQGNTVIGSDVALVWNACVDFGAWDAELGRALLNTTRSLSSDGGVGVADAALVLNAMARLGASDKRLATALVKACTVQSEQLDTAGAVMVLRAAHQLGVPDGDALKALGALGPRGASDRFRRLKPQEIIELLERSAYGVEAGELAAAFLYLSKAVDQVFTLV